MINADRLSEFMNSMCVCVCVYASVYAYIGEWPQAKNSGVREVRPFVRHPGGEETGDESEGDGRTGREGDLHPGPDQEVWRPSGGEL